MAFCTNCGQQVDVGTKFCANCGTSIAQSNAKTERKTVFEGEIHKCPRCGEALNSFETVCPTCKFELRGVRGSSAVSELVQKLEQLDKTKDDDSFVKGVVKKIFKRKNNGFELSPIEKQKISLISNFPIPNTKEDILEFMILSSSHILSKGPDEDFSEHDELLYNEQQKAWKMKFEQAYDKAKICIKNDEDRKEIEQYYVKTIIEPRRKRNKILKIKAILSIIAVATAALVIIAIMLLRPKSETPKQDPNFITVGFSYEDIEGQYYEDVVEMFENNGFTNIEVRADGWSLFHKEGKVKRVTINGNDEFYSSSEFHKDVKIIVFYYE